MFFSQEKVLQDDKNKPIGENAVAQAKYRNCTLQVMVSRLSWIPSSKCPGSQIPQENISRIPDSTSQTSETFPGFQNPELSYMHGETK